MIEMNPNIPRITKILAKPKKGDWRGGVFVVERSYPGVKGTSRAWMTPEEFKIAKMKESMSDKGLSPRIIEKFEDLVREHQRTIDAQNEAERF
jgi:hypothetical protein